LKSDASAENSSWEHDISVDETSKYVKILFLFFNRKDVEDCRRGLSAYLNVRFGEQVKLAFAVRPKQKIK
jgi:hypothetical protein